MITHVRGLVELLNDCKVEHYALVHCFESAVRAGDSTLAGFIAGKLVICCSLYEVYREELRSFFYKYASTFPVTELVSCSRSMMARCISPDHEDRTPSMYCRDNYAYCFGCGFSGTSVEVYSLLSGVSRDRAILELSLSLLESDDMDEDSKNFIVSALKEVFDSMEDS
jgi:hypothetical protein